MSAESPEGRRSHAENLYSAHQDVSLLTTLANFHYSMASSADKESEECYKTLELDRYCSAVDIKRSFQRLVKKVA